MVNDDIEKAAYRVLAAIQKVEPTAKIAGGFVRDLILGKPIKDIDIWGDFGETIDQYEIHKAIESTGLLTTIVGFGGSGIGTPEVKDIVTFHVDDGGLGPYAVDLISLQSKHADYPEEVFDFGICRAALTLDDDGKPVVITTKEFLDDVENRTLTLFPGARSADNKRRILLDRVPRMKAKFPGFKFVGLPDEKELV